MVQLVTSKPSDVGVRVRISAQSRELGIFSQIAPNKWRTILSCVNKIDFTVDEGKGRLNPSRDKKLRQAPPQKKGGEK